MLTKALDKPHTAVLIGFESSGKSALLLSLAIAKPIRPKAKELLKPDFPAVQPQLTWFEHSLWGRLLSRMMTLLLFAVPVLHVGQVFALAYLASTLTACLVTLWSVRKEPGGSFASSLGGKQALTSIVSTVIIMLVAGR